MTEIKITKDGVTIEIKGENEERLIEAAKEIFSVLNLENYIYWPCYQPYVYPHYPIGTQIFYTSQNSGSSE